MRKVHAKSAQVQISTVYSVKLPILRYILTLDQCFPSFLDDSPLKIGQATHSPLRSILLLHHTDSRDRLD